MIKAKLSHNVKISVLKGITKNTSMDKEKIQVSHTLQVHRQKLISTRENRAHDEMVRSQGWTTVCKGKKAHR